MYVCRVGDSSKRYRIAGPKDTPGSSFPSAWFAEHKQKPTVVIPTGKFALDILTGGVNHYLFGKADDLPVDLVS